MPLKLLMNWFLPKKSTKTKLIKNLILSIMLVIHFENVKQLSKSSFNLQTYLKSKIIKNFTNSY